MAATATRFDSTKVGIGAGTLWANLAVPGTGARLTLTSGTPDSVENPSAKHLGHTADGTNAVITTEITDYFADESPFPIKSVPGNSTVELSGNLLQVFDEEVLQVLAANIGTYSTAAGYKQLTLGQKATITYTALAIIVPTPMDATKYGVFMIYNGLNAGGLSIQIGRTARTQTPFNFKGTALTARATADTLGNYWWQI